MEKLPKNQELIDKIYTLKKGQHILFPTAYGQRVRAIVCQRKAKGQGVFKTKKEDTSVTRLTRIK